MTKYIEAWATMRKNCMTYKRIAEIYDTTVSKVYYALNNIKPTIKGKKSDRYGNKWITLYDRGHTITYIADKYKTSKKDVSKYLRSQGIKIIPRGSTCRIERKQVMTEAIQLLRKGKTVKETAIEIGIHPNSLPRIFKEFGLKAKDFKCTKEESYGTLWLECFENDMTPSEIAKLFKTSTKRVKQYLISKGKIDNRTYTKRYGKAFSILYNAGYNSAEIAEAFNISKDAVCNVLNNVGIERRNKGYGSPRQGGLQMKAVEKLIV